MRLLAILVSAIVVTGAVRAEAAVQPNMQQLIELQTVLMQASTTLGEKRPIEKLERIETDKYRVSSRDCSVTLTVQEIPVPSSMFFKWVMKKVGTDRLVNVVPGPLACGNA